MKPDDKYYHSGEVLDGECYSSESYLNYFDNHRYNNVFHREFTATTPQACINTCKTDIEDQFSYAGIHGTSCYCGNVHPYLEADSCTTPCEGDNSKTCGGPNNSTNFYTISNQSKLKMRILFKGPMTSEQLCDFGIREADDGNYLVRHMQSSVEGSDYRNHQHCWAKFSCSSERHVEYKIGNNYELENGCDYLTLYENSNKRLTEITGTFSPLGQWVPMNDSSISIEFRTDHSVIHRGIEIEFKCIPN